MLKEIALDIDGDGSEEIAVAEQIPGGQVRAILLARTGSTKVESGSFRLIAEGTPSPGSAVLQFEAKRISGRAAPELLAVFDDPSPDEAAQHVRIMGATGRGIRELFAHTFFIPKEAPQDPAVVQYGDASPRFVVLDVDENDSDLEVVWVRGPQKIDLENDKGKVAFVIGAYRTIFRFQPKTENFEVDTDRDVVEFLPPRPPAEVIASSQVGKVWGTAQPFWATDGDLETAWSVDGRKGGVGESLTIRFDKDLELSMVRVVPGCAEDVSAWTGNRTVSAFRLVLSSGTRLDIDRRKLKNPPRGVRAMGEFPLDEGFGVQNLIFLSEKQSIRWARFEIVGITKGARPDPVEAETCVSEISFH